MYQAFKEMPTLLKFITGHALVCFVFFVAAVILGVPIAFNGEVLESQELWAKGVGLPTVAIGLALPVVGVLFLLRWQYCRQVYSLILVAVMVAPYVIWREVSSLIFGLVLSCAIIGYLFLNGKVRAYFRS
jgi:hypothetical protein